jgi:hypothetical protein
MWKEDMREGEALKKRTYDTQDIAPFEPKAHAAITRMLKCSS